jgi:hypothetical protein
VNQEKSSPTEVTVMVTLLRTKFSAAQVEKDTFTAVFKQQSWFIDRWGSDIAYSSH